MTSFREEISKLRLLCVEPKARPLGTGRRLFGECIGSAGRAGYHKITLWTNDVLVSARRIYRAAGFRLVQEERHRSFGQGLVGQYWELALPARGRDTAQHDAAGDSALSGSRPDLGWGSPPMRLQFLGCGDALGSGGRFNTCFRPPQAIFEGQLGWILSKKIRHV
jgi:hypothetical protein